jgi:hypothetical protein
MKQSIIEYVIMIRGQMVYTKLLHEMNESYCMIYYESIILITTRWLSGWGKVPGKGTRERYPGKFVLWMTRILFLFSDDQMETVRFHSSITIDN